MDDLTGIFFPALCNACRRSLRKGEEAVCIFCRYQLPKNRFLPGTGNPVELLFRGRAPVIAASALYSYSKAGKVQQLVHALKYRGRFEVASYAGRRMAEEWSSYPGPFPDVVVPVPLHASRELERGYNQSALLADAVAEVLELPLDTSSLIRTASDASQTSKHRYERFESLDGKFRVAQPECLLGKRILLVDDVITTGATAIACAQALSIVEGTEVLVAAMAAARR